MSSPTVPREPYSPYVATAEYPWDGRRIGHLLRRAGLGSTSERVETLAKLSPRQAVDSLLDFDPDKDPLNDLLDQLQGFFNLQKIEDVQGWWYYRMLVSDRPAQERIALFWHNRFATSAGKVNNPSFMHRQIELFRHSGLGNFRDLLISVTHDPAMLVWLDGQSNVKGHPNENYAREVMELFTLGIGHYTEQDVQQLARAFTGWQINNGKAAFNNQSWDNKEKEIFGVRGNFDSEGAVDLLLRQEAAPKFIAGKILREFVHPEPTDQMIAHYASRLVDLKWEIKPLMKDIFTSRLFNSDWAYHSRIKSPVELCVGAALALGGRPNADFLGKSAAKMGQNLLFPPNVKGWDGGEAWINSNTVLMRFNFGMAIATERHGEFARKPDLEEFLAKHNIKNADDVVDYYARLLMDGQLTAEARADLIGYLNRGPDGKPKAFEFTHDTFNNQVREVLHLMMATPEYQLA